MARRIRDLRAVRDPRDREQPLAAEAPTAEDPRPAPQAGAYESALLGDARIVQGGSEPVRVALMRHVQQSQGNRAAGRMLARVPNPALEATPTAAVGHKTGAQIDAYLDASPFFKALIADGVKAGKKADGHVHIHAAAEFATLCAAYLTGKTNPNTSAPFTAEEAAEYAKNVNAYQEGKEIHVHEERGEAATTIHESMHLFEHDSWLPAVGWNVNEGTTEFFTKKLCAEQAITRGDYYPDQHKSVKKLADAVGENFLAEAYFHGNLLAIAIAVERLRKDEDDAGAVVKVVNFLTDGLWVKWVTFMQASRYAEADALL